VRRGVAFVLLITSAMACGSGQHRPPIAPPSSVAGNKGTAFNGNDCPGGTAVEQILDYPSANPPGPPTAEEALARYLGTGPRLRPEVSSYVPRAASSGRGMDFLHYNGARVDAVVHIAHGINGWWIVGFEACAP